MLIYLEAAAGILATAYALIGLMWLYATVSLRLQVWRAHAEPGAYVDLQNSVNATKIGRYHV